MIFEKNHENDNYSDFYKFTLYMIFQIFNEKNGHYRNGHFQERSESHILGEFVKILEFILVRLEIESFEISRNSA